jgi:hypothetical protein
MWGRQISRRKRRQRRRATLPATAASSSLQNRQRWEEQGSEAIVVRLVAKVAVGIVVEEVGLIGIPAVVEGGMDHARISDEGLDEVGA